MKIHPAITDRSGVVHRWVVDFEMLFFDRTNLSTIEKFMYHWWWLSIPYALCYILLVFLGQTWMRRTNRRYDLRNALIAWNTFLAIFSFWGACRCVPELVQSLSNRRGLYHSLCNPILKEGVTGFW